MFHLKGKLTTPPPPIKREREREKDLCTMTRYFRMKTYSIVYLSVSYVYWEITMEAQLGIIFKQLIHSIVLAPFKSMQRLTGYSLKIQPLIISSLALC